MKRPLRGHPYHSKDAAALRFIIKDAAEAMKNVEAMGDSKNAAKYADQINDAATVLCYRESKNRRNSNVSAME